MFEYFTQEAIKTVMLAQEEARRLGQKFVGTEQILLGLLGEGTGIAAQVLNELGVTLADARTEVKTIIGESSGFVPTNIPFTPRAKSVFEQAFQESRQLGQSYVSTEHLLLGLVKDWEGVAAKVLDNFGVEQKEVRTAIIRRVGEVASMPAGGRKRGGSDRQTKTTTLDEFSTNLTKLAAEGKIDPVVGRQKEIERAIQILGRRTKNNPVLIGEPGVGKTAIASGLAQLIVDQKVPDFLEDKQVISLDMGSLLAGTKYRGEFEERLKGIVEEVRVELGLVP